jgi:hypothetical protein
VAITVGDLESVLKTTHLHDLTDILDQYYSHHRTASGTVAFGRMAYANIPLLKDAERGRDIVCERFKRFNEDLIANIFAPERGHDRSDPQSVA